MGVGRIAPDFRLPGREADQQVLADALEHAAGGEPRAVVVQGEAGIGKTRLVRSVCEAVAGDFDALWGTCVHFGAASVPFAPVSGALHAWSKRADTATKREVLAGAPELTAAAAGAGWFRHQRPRTSAATR